MGLGAYWQDGSKTLGQVWGLVPRVWPRAERRRRWPSTAENDRRGLWLCCVNGTVPRNPFLHRLHNSTIDVVCQFRWADPCRSAFSFVWTHGKWLGTRKPHVVFVFMQTITLIDVRAREDGVGMPAGPRSQYACRSLLCVLITLTLFCTFTYVSCI